MFYRLIRRSLKSRRLWGSLRVLTYLVVLNSVLMVLCVRWAWADAEKAVQSAGLALLSRIGPLPLYGAQPLVINGQRVFFASQHTSLAVPEVLNVVDQHCQQNSSGLAEELGKLPPKIGPIELPDQFRDPSRWTVLREQSKDDRVGQLGCLAQPQGGGFRAVLERVKAFMDSGDLSKLGDARYVTARRSEDGKSTHVLAVWTEGSFNFKGMLPSEGDAPGRDAENAPRPPDARRVFSAEVPDQPYAVRMYDSTRPRADLLGFYDREMAGRGWMALPVAPGPDGDKFVIHHPESRSFVKGGSALLITTDDLDGGKTGVTLIEMGGTGAAHAVVND